MAAIETATQAASPNSETLNRRRQTRHDDSTAMRVALRERDAASAETVEAQLVDFSVHGCGLFVGRNVAPGSPVELLIERPASGESFILGGIIRWCGELHPEFAEPASPIDAAPAEAPQSVQFRAGIELSDRSRPDFERWEQFVSQTVTED